MVETKKIGKIVRSQHSPTKDQIKLIIAMDSNNPGHTWIVFPHAPYKESESYFKRGFGAYDSPLLIEINLRKK
jgi:hypothetical protein